MKNKNYICLNGQKIEIPQEKIQEFRKALGCCDQFQIEQMENGEKIAHVGKFDFLVLERSGDTVSLLLKDLYCENAKFGSNNDFRGSNVQNICLKFAKDLAEIVGEENIVEHTVDLTSDDGLKDYGTVKEKASLLTTALYRRYVDVLDIDRLQKYYWLVTPYSTPRHENAAWVKCVSPLGPVLNDDCYFDRIGVRPFCILKSNIFVS